MQYQLSPNSDPLPLCNFTDALVARKFVQKLPPLYKLYLRCFIAFYRRFMNTWSALGEQAGKRTLDQIKFTVQELFLKTEQDVSVEGYQLQPDELSELLSLPALELPTALDDENHSENSQIQRNAVVKSRAQHSRE